MKTNAKTLRTLVMENSLELGRLTSEQVGKEDYAELTRLYTDALDAITDWASKDYNHTSDGTEHDICFDKVKAILSLYATDDERIIIDDTAMRTIRDSATKPQRQYSKVYKEAEKSRRNAKKTAEERYNDLMTLEAPSIDEDEKIADYVARVRESGINVVVDGIDMLKMFENAMATLTVRTKKVEDIKKAGKWTWIRIAPVDTNGKPKVFADLVENYIADCLIDGRNIKSAKNIRDDKKAERDAAK